MPRRNLRPAAIAVVRLILRACGWEPVYESAKDILTIAATFRGPSTPPASEEIQRIVDWAQASLSSIFQTEYAQAADNDINAAALAVADVLNLPMRDELLVRAVTDSSLLESQLLEIGGEAIRRNLLSEDAISAFDLLLRSACQHLAEVTLSAPEFGPLALRQLLRTQDQLEAISKQIYQSLTVLTTSSYTERDFANFTSRYMAKVSEQLDFLDIPGIDLDRYRQRYNLTMAYIPMTTRSQGAQQFELTSLDSIMRTTNFLLVAGEPGSGKSTLLKWAAVQTARSHINLNTYQQTVPFLVKLRALPESLPSLDDIGAPMTEGLVVPKPSDWSEDLISSGRAMLLFDGLDEVAEHRRESIVKWIDQIYEDHGRRGTRIIVTTRITAIRESRFRSSYATLATLEPMPQAKVERFVRLWHRAVFTSTDTPRLSEWLATSEQLLARLEGDPQLARLASNPLLCAVICALYHARNQHLPSERSEVYAALLAMLLARRDSERQGIETLLSLTDTQRLAQQVALSYLNLERDELPRAKILDVLRTSLGSFRNHTIRDMRPSLVLDYFVSRTGVLRELPPEGAVDFWHKSFQEFLAAQMLLAQGRDEELLSHATDAAWREVVIWAASFMTIERASSLIVSLLDAVDEASEEADRNYLTSVALSCAHYTLQLRDDAQRRINECASTLIPPMSGAQLNMIVDLGTAAIPFLQEYLNEAGTLRENRKMSERIVTVLARIGGEAANTALNHVSADLKEYLAPSLAQGWSYTGSEDYARRVLGTIPEKKWPFWRRVAIKIESFRQLRSIDYLSEIYSPRIEVSMGDLDREALGPGSSRDIAVATLVGTTWEDALFFLSRYPSVEELHLTLSTDSRDLGDQFQVIDKVLRLSITAEAQIELNFDDLRMFPSLRTLEIFGSVDLIGRNGFSDDAFALLKEVSIDLTDGSDASVSWRGGIEHLSYEPWPYSSIEPLRELAYLHELSIVGSPVLETLDGTQYLPEITSLDVSYCTELHNIDDALLSGTVVNLNIEGCDESLSSDLQDLYVEVDVGPDDIGRLGPESPTPSLIGDRWLYWELGELSDSELDLRGWNDWWVWEEIKGDADEWATPDPVDAEEASAVEENLVIYDSFKDWRDSQEDAQREELEGREDHDNGWADGGDGIQ